LRYLILAVLAGCSLGVAGCAQRGVRPEPVAELPPLALAPALLGATVSVAQRLSFRATRGAQRAADGASIDAVLEVDAASLRVAAVALGRRVFALQWDGARLDEQRDPRLPPELSAKRILRDIQFAYWPVDALRGALPHGWRIDTRGGTRELVHGGDTVLLRASRAGASTWQGQVTIENLAEGYELVIESRVQGD
jgi:hypothetical protein